MHMQAGADSCCLCGDRFDPNQCVRWLHLLTVSVLCCVFITQPLLVSGGRGPPAGSLCISGAWEWGEGSTFLTHDPMSSPLTECEENLGDRPVPCCPHTHPRMGGIS